ncbi:MAG TPA: dienelactone hydrolase family protein [Ktedonobacterales bacterium]|nr:dienelactone hydrolase family protein [Ktedonobacterales bacterium]
MTGRMIEFDSAGTPAPGYLALPDGGTGPGVVVLHAWWGLTEPFRDTCDRLAAAGFAALAPDLYRGESTAVIAEAEQLVGAMDGQIERVRADVAGAVAHLRAHHAGGVAGGGKTGLIGFSMGGAYALDSSVLLADEVAAVVTFYAAWTGPDFARAKAAYLCHFAEHDDYEPAEEVANLEGKLQAAGRPVTVYTYPGTKHWFFETNRPDAYDAAAAALAWERTAAFLRETLTA